MAAQISEEKLNELPILWEDDSGKFRLVRNDERNLEIIQNKTLGLAKKGRKTEVRDCWVSIPSYHSNLSMAFNKLLEMKAESLLMDGQNTIEWFRNALLEFRNSFANVRG